VFEEMNAQNSLDDETRSNITNFDFPSEEPGAFFEFDPMWELSVTIEFYFQYAVIAIGVFGTAANALVLYALIAYHLKESKKRAINLLMINQNVLDLTSCILLIVTFSIKVSNIYLTGTLGYFLCTILLSENATNCTLNASIINLTSCNSLLVLFVKCSTAFHTSSCFCSHKILPATLCPKVYVLVCEHLSPKLTVNHFNTILGC